MNYKDNYGMNYNQKCPKCGVKMKSIPIMKLDSTFVIEYYCEKCDYSMTFYPKRDIMKSGNASFF